MNKKTTPSNNDKTVFMGAVNQRSHPTCGETAKNQALVTHLRRRGYNVVVIDTYRWKTSPLVLLRVMTYMLFNRDRGLIISAATHSANKLMKLIRLFPRPGNLYYFVVGGSFAQRVREGRYKAKHYRPCNRIFVQGREMVSVLKKCGLTNVEYLPNFRHFPIIPSNSVASRSDFPCGRSELRFVFISRIHEKKGVFLLLDAIHKVNTLMGGFDGYSVDFWGPIDQKPKVKFFDRLGTLPNAHYMGILDTQSEHGYSTLSAYDAMIFPTYWDGEGFPGVVIDAFIAGLPILASRWNMNPEIIEEGVLGILFEPKDETALAQTLMGVINEPASLRAMSFQCKEESMKYHADTVLGQIDFSTN